MYRLAAWLVRQLLGLAAIAAFVPFLLALWYCGAAATGTSSYWLLWWVPAVGLIILVSIAAHEVGHILAALAGGFRLLLIVIGPLKIIRERNALRARWNNPLGGSLGYVVGVMPSNHNYRRRMAVFVACGPVASLLAAATCLALTWRLSGASTWEVAEFLWDSSSLPTPTDVVLSLLILAGMFNLACGLSSLIPSRREGWVSDGALLIDLLRGGRGVERDQLLMALTAALLEGVRPRDWDEALMQRLLALRRGLPEDFASNLYAYYHALDRGDVAAAGDFLVLAMAQRHSRPATFHPAVLLEAAFFEAFHLGNAAPARGWLESAKGHAEEQTRLRAEAAVLWAEGRYDEAAAKARAGLDAVPRSADPGGARAEADWLSAILVDAQKRSADASYSADLRP